MKIKLCAMLALPSILYAMDLSICEEVEVVSEYSDASEDVVLMANPESPAPSRRKKRGLTFKSKLRSEEEESGYDDGDEDFIAEDESDEPDFDEDLHANEEHAKKTSPGPKRAAKELEKKRKRTSKPNSERKRRKKESDVTGGNSHSSTTLESGRVSPVITSELIGSQPLPVPMPSVESAPVTILPVPEPVLRLPAVQVPVLNAIGFIDVHRRVNGQTVLHAFLAKGIAIIEALLAKGAPINAVDSHGNTVLIKAVEMNDRALVHFLLSRGAAINQTNNDGQTPLMIAASRNALDLLKLLMDHGADQSLRDGQGRTFIDYFDPVMKAFVSAMLKRKQ